MKIGIGTAFVLAVIFHGALLAVLAVNVSLDRPERPEEKPGQIMHATIINVPPAKGSPTGQPPKNNIMQDTQKLAQEAAAKARAEAEAKAKAELAKKVAAQKKAEAERQKALALKKAEEAKRKAEEEKKRIEAEKKKAEEERLKAEAEAKAKAEAEAKAKAEAEAKAKAEAEAKAKAEAEAKAKAEAEAKAKAEAEARAKAEAERKAAEEAARQAALQQQAESLEQELLGRANGVEGGQGLGSGTGSDDSQVYGAKVQQLIEQNWRIDPSMNGKRVVVTVSIDENGMIYNEKCQGDSAVCASAIATLNLIGMMPRPPVGCKDCNTIVITMTPKL